MKQFFNLIIFILLSSFQWKSNTIIKTVNAVPNAQTHYLNKTLIEEMLNISRNSTRDDYVKKTLAEASGIIKITHVSNYY